MNAMKGGSVFTKGKDMLVAKSDSQEAPWDHETADGGWRLGSAGPPWAPGFKGKGRTYVKRPLPSPQPCLPDRRVATCIRGDRNPRRGCSSIRLP